MNLESTKKKLKRFEPLFPPLWQRLGISTWKAIEIPLSSMLERRSVLHAHRIVWPVAEVADIQPYKILGPADDDTAVRVAYTAISPGTKRAQLLALPGTLKASFASFFPGYSGSGTVFSVGKNIKNFKIGDRVAGRIQHGTPAIVKEPFLFHVPETVSLEAAAFVELGIIVLQSIRKAAICPGESMLIIGQGLIGQLANRLGHLAGGAPIVAVANSRSKEKHSLMNGGADKFLTADELKDQKLDKAFDIVIEATGDKDIFSFACRFVRPGGRVIGLGTPRGFSHFRLDCDAYPANISFIGAHISGMPAVENSPGRRTYQSEGRLFLDLLADRKLSVEDLISQRLDPSDATNIYESLKNNSANILGAVFDWGQYARE